MASAKGQYHAHFEIQYIVVWCVPALDGVGMVDHAEARISTLENFQGFGQFGTREVDQGESAIMVVVVIQRPLTMH
jgi:hypothetical protein